MDLNLRDNDMSHEATRVIFSRLVVFSASLCPKFALMTRHRMGARTYY